MKVRERYIKVLDYVSAFFDKKPNTPLDRILHLLLYMPFCMMMMMCLWLFAIVAVSYALWRLVSYLPRYIINGETEFFG